MESTYREQRPFLPGCPTACLVLPLSARAFLWVLVLFNLLSSISSYSLSTLSASSTREKDQSEGLLWRGLIFSGFRQTNGGIIVCFPRVIHFSGRGKSCWGFIWNQHKAALQSYPVSLLFRKGRGGRSFINQKNDFPLSYLLLWVLFPKAWAWEKTRGLTTGLVVGFAPSLDLELKLEGVEPHSLHQGGQCWLLTSCCWHRNPLSYLQQSI